MSFVLQRNVISEALVYRYYYIAGNWHFTLHKDLLVAGLICEIKSVASLRNDILVVSKPYPKNNNAYFFLVEVATLTFSSFRTLVCEKKIHPGTHLFIALMRPYQRDI